MTMATTTIRIDIARLPDHLDRSRPNAVKTSKVEVTTHSANRVGSWFTQVIDKASEFMKDDES